MCLSRKEDGPLIKLQYPRPMTQPTFIRYIATLPFKRVIIINLAQPFEEGVPKTCLPSYRRAITQKPHALVDVLYDNTVSPEDRAEWAEFNAQWMRTGTNAAQNDAIRKRALRKAREQIMTYPAPDEAQPPSGHCEQAVKANPADRREATAVRAPREWSDEHKTHILEGYVGEMPVLHLHFGKWRQQQALKQDRAALMRLVLAYLLPGHTSSLTFGKAQPAADQTAMLLMWCVISPLNVFAL